MNKALIIHGWNATPNGLWFKDLGRELSKLGYEVKIPVFPGGYYPKIEQWLQVIHGVNPGDDWVVIGHSLGGVAALKYLENIDHPICRLVLISTPIDSMSFDPIKNFFEGNFDWDKIKAHCKSIDIVTETDDPIVPSWHGIEYQKTLGGRIYSLPGYTHFTHIDLDTLVKIVTAKA